MTIPIKIRIPALDLTLDAELDVPGGFGETEPERYAYNAGEVATRTGLSVDTIRRLTASGELGHVREGRRILYLPSDVRDYLESRRHPARVYPIRGGGTA